MSSDSNKLYEDESKTRKKVVVLFSGGLDSTVALALAKETKEHVIAFSVNYGQKHSAELEQAFIIAKILKVVHIVSHIVIPGFNADASNPNPIIPNRNMMLISIAAAFAENLGYDEVWYGPTLEDVNFPFPDCTEPFVLKINEALEAANLKVRLYAPFIRMTKLEVAKLGKRLGAPLEETMSCYNGTNCGVCLACKLRNQVLEDVNKSS